MSKTAIELPDWKSLQPLAAFSSQSLRNAGSQFLAETRLSQKKRQRYSSSSVTFILIASSASTASAGSRFDLVFTQPARWCGSSDQVAKGAQCGPGSVAGGNYGLLVRHRSAVASGKHAGMLVQTRLFISSLQSASASPCPWAYRVLGRDAFQRLLLHRPSRSQHQTITVTKRPVCSACQAQHCRTFHCTVLGACTHRARRCSAADSAADRGTWASAAHCCTHLCCRLPSRARKCGVNWSLCAS